MGSDRLDNQMRETAVGPLPADWTVVPLGELATLLQYGTSQRCHEAPTGNPVLRIPNVIGGSIDPSDLKYAELPNSEGAKYRLAKGDLLFVRTNGQKEYIGRCAAYEGTPPDALFASYLIRAKVRSDQADYEFVRLYASSSVGRSFLSGRASNASDGKYNLNTQILRDVLVPLPPLDEQRAIARILRTVQQAKEATEKAVAASRQLKQSLMRNLFTYGPVPVEEADRVPLKDTAIGSIPEHWQVKPLECLADLVSGGTPSKSRADYWQGDIPWASPKDMKVPRLSETVDYISAEAAKEGSRVVPAGSVFIVIRGMILAKNVPVALATRPMAFNQDMKAIIPKPSLHPDFLLYALVQHKGRLMPDIGTSAHGTKRISTSAISAFLLPLPPLAEQEEIASLLARIDRRLVADESRRAALQSLFDSLLHHLMTGKIRVDGKPD